MERPDTPASIETSYEINHANTVDLDSTNAFEGPEKLLEVWFTPSPEILPESAQPEGLMSVSQQIWEEMLDVVHCKVLSVVRSEHVHAYLLSESSMFVFKHKVILKTCGTTTLLHGLPHMLRIATEIAGFPPGKPGVATPYRVFYSRKSFMFPGKQLFPHTSWDDEVSFLEKEFLNGSAYMVGKMNGEHWYLYLTNPGTILTPPHTPTNEAQQASRTTTKLLKFPDGAHDETLEILMTELDPIKAKQFYLEDASAVAKARYLKEVEGKSDDEMVFLSNGETEFPAELTSEGHVLGDIVSDACGLSAVYANSSHKNSKIDSYVFSPCGFSANGVIPSKTYDTTHYFTVHVTPEPHCSYASFETNVPTNQSGRETAEIVEHVTDIFKPGKFSVTLFETKPVGDDYDYEQFRKAARMDRIKGYKRVEKIVHDLDGYDLVFRCYHRIQE
ncbi:S-adenosylmethionine decarboxylase [Ascobolus immersus RN42]|uniref:adenosylmethionine decarboxylase n=1 Tax=Ascobolus immersus RN42 TaxID=1160509 RepID=A0A3N4IAE9_ASCIM|nr:S-adenosylmethionine decarboxylase [Ascobolus immersus RN42]